MWLSGTQFSTILDSSQLLASSTIARPATVAQWLDQALSNTRLDHAEHHVGQLVSAFHVLGYRTWNSLGIIALHQLGDDYLSVADRIAAAHQLFTQVQSRPQLVELISNIPQARHALIDEQALHDRGAPLVSLAEKYITGKWLRVDSTGLFSLETYRGQFNPEARELRAEMIRARLESSLMQQSDGAKQMMNHYKGRIAEAIAAYVTDRQVFQEAIPGAAMNDTGALQRILSDPQLFQELFLEEDTTAYELLFGDEAISDADYMLMVTYLPRRRPAPDDIKHAFNSLFSIVGLSNTDLSEDFNDLLMERWVRPFGNYGWPVAGILAEQLPGYYEEYTQTMSRRHSYRPLNGPWHGVLVGTVKAIWDLRRQAGRIVSARLEVSQDGHRPLSDQQLLSWFELFRETILPTLDNLKNNRSKNLMSAEELRGEFQRNTFRLVRDKATSNFSTARLAVQHPILNDPAFLEAALTLMVNLGDIYKSGQDYYRRSGLPGAYRKFTPRPLEGDELSNVLEYLHEACEGVRLLNS